MQPDELQRSLGEVIRARRTALGLSQEAFAERCKLHRTYAGSVERGERNVTLVNIARIATALGVPPSVLLDEAERLAERGS